jgi:hypothetical protein
MYSMKCLSRKAFRIALFACLTLLISDLALHRPVSAQNSATQISPTLAKQNSGSMITLTVAPPKLKDVRARTRQGFYALEKREP